jgi:predicted homoserine dehydrogenase-like protein
MKLRGGTIPRGVRGRMVELLAERSRAGRPLRVALVGAGTFGSMLLGQARRLSGLEIACVADLDVERARTALRVAGYASGEVEATDDAVAAIRGTGVDVVVEATGAPLAGVEHALAAIEAGRHVVMVNVEADALAGPALAERARDAGVVYSLAYGDQPALVCELVDWARCCGFDVVCAGKGTKYLPNYHAITPETVWEHYGLSAEQIEMGGFSARMFTSFVDGTKSAIEMAAVCNATGLEPQAEGLRFPPAGAEDLARVCVPEPAGGMLSRSGTVEVVSSLGRDGSELPGNLRWGVFVTFEAPSTAVADWFAAYGLATDASGRFAALYRPYHLIGLEATVSVLSVGLLAEPTGCPSAFVADVVAVAKRDLDAETTLDGEGGFTVHGALVPAGVAAEQGLLPIGLSDGLALRRPVHRGRPVRLEDVDPPAPSRAFDLRAELMAERSSRSADPAPAARPDRAP